MREQAWLADDGLEQEDLLAFVSDVAEIGKQAISNVSIQNGLKPLT